MICKNCGSSNNKVVDVRVTEYGKRRRRRECVSCGHRFTTYEIEILELLDLLDMHLEDQIADKISAIILKEFPSKPF